MILSITVRVNLKWFEAACFKIPSVVSNTQNYLDVIEDGVDAMIAGTTGGVV